MTDADTTILDDAPNLTALYARAVRPTGGAGTGGLPTTTVVRREVAIDRERVAAYADVCGFRVTDALPVPYLHLLAFPLSVHLMTGAEFPYPLLGTIHLHQRIVVHRPVTTEDRVDVAVRLEDLRPHRTGVQFDVHATVTSGDEVVWTGRSTYLRRDVELPQVAGGSTSTSAGAGDDARPPDAVDATALPTTARWPVPGDTGRAYAGVSGDRNPIHLSALTARPLGFRRPIAHGMWTLARAVAGLEGRLSPTPVVDVSFGSPLLLPSIVTYATEQRGDDWLVGVRPDGEGRPHLVGVVAHA